MAVGQLLIWLSGARKEILGQCPTDLAKYVGIGATILLTASMAAVSLTFALVTVLNVGLFAALPFALAWGVAILSVDRLFVVSLQRQENRLSYLSVAVPRLLLALLLGFVISTPFVLQIFRPEIEDQISKLHVQAATAYFKQLPSNSLSKQIAADQAQVASLTSVASTGGSGVNISSDATLNRLITLRDQAQAQATKDYNEWQCQLYGVPPSGKGKCPPGNGALAAQSGRAYNADVQQVNLYDQQIQSQQKSLLNSNSAAREGAAAQAQSQLPAAKLKLQNDQREQAQETAAFLSNNKSDTGLLIRLQALNDVTAGNLTLDVTRWLLFILFVIIDCLPVTVKVLLNLGPENNYEKMLTAEERTQLRIASNNRALRQAAEFRSASAAVGELRSREVGWHAEIPEITQEIIAARKRVERERLRAWESDQRQRIGSGRLTESELPASWPGEIAVGQPSVGSPSVPLRAWRRGLRQARGWWERMPKPPGEATPAQEPYSAPGMSVTRSWYQGSV